jgi:hypothetical protein
MDQKESVYEHVAERREQGGRIGTGSGELGGKASGGRFLDNCADAAQAQEAQEPALARGSGVAIASRRWWVKCVVRRDSISRDV